MNRMQRYRDFWRARTESKAAAWIAFGCIPVICISSFTRSSVTDITLGLFVITALALIAVEPARAARLPMLLAACWVFYVVLSATAQTVGHTGYSFASLGKHFQIAIGPLAGVALGRICERLRLRPEAVVTVFLSSMVAGALLVLFRNGADLMVLDLSHVRTVLNGDRFGRLNRNFAALACSLALIATTGLICRFYFRRRWHTAADFTLLATLSITFGALAALLIALPSRTAYLATGVAMVILLGRFTLSKSMRRDRGASVVAAMLLAALAVIASTTAFYLPTMADRMDSIRQQIGRKPNAVEVPVIGGLVGGSAAGERLQLAALAIEQFRKRPLFGSGPDVSRLIAASAPTPETAELTQFHNGYLQDLVSFGLAGVLIEIALVWAIFKEAYKGWSGRDGCRLSPVYSATALALTFYLFIYNLTETVLHVKPAGFTAIFLVGLACLKYPASCDSQPISSDQTDTRARS